jgi:hypothetical protein
MDGDAPAQPDASDAANAGDTNSTGEDGGCTSTTALLGGNSSSLVGAIATGTSAFASSSITGSTTTTPALVAFAGGFQALVTAAGDAGGGNALFSTGYATGAWSMPATLGGEAIAIGAPGVGIVASTLQGVYLNPSHLYFHAAYSTSWDMGADPVRPSDGGGAQAFGPVPPVAVGTPTELVMAYQGNNLLPYAQTWTSGVGWDDGVSLGSADLLANTGLAIAGLDAGTSDLLAVYVEAAGSCTGATDCLYAVTRDSTSKAWSAPAMVNAAAYSPSAPTLTTMSGGRALLAWKGGNGEGYESVYTAGATPAWSTPAQLTSAQLTSAPALAPGVCGDDAEAAYVSAGQVYTTHFVGGAWTTPASFAAGSGATSVAIATSP